jgi:F0F1-type ATP synthase assembly protein I
MALDMSWRLALAVLLPVIGGYELDQKLETSPWLLLTGFVLALAGVALVMWRTVKVASKQPIPPVGKVGKN